MTSAPEKSQFDKKLPVIEVKDVDSSTFKSFFAGDLYQTEGDGKFNAMAFVIFGFTQIIFYGQVTRQEAWELHNVNAFKCFNFAPEVLG